MRLSFNCVKGKIVGLAVLVAALAAPVAVLAVAAEPPSVTSSAIFWLDASAMSTITTNASGQVTKWASRVGSNYAKAPASGLTYPTFDDTTYGIKTVDFGALGSNKDLLINTRMTTIRTVFLVVKIVADGGAFWLGDSSNTYDFHRGGNGAYANATYGKKFDKVWNGFDQVANINTDIPDPSVFNVITLQMNANTIAGSLTRDRAQSGRNGGRQLSELICFNKTLTDAEREAVIRYLEMKWGTFKGIGVTAEPEEFQVNSLPSYNVFPMQDGATSTFTAPSGTAFLNAGETTRGYVRGYRVDTFDAATGKWVSGAEVASLSYAHTQSAGECKRLVWLWNAENKISVVSQSATERVSTNGTDWVQSLEEWYPYGSTATIYAGTSDGRLYTWSGLPSGTVYGARSATVGVPMNAPRSFALLDAGFTVTHIWAGPSANFATASAWLTPSGAVSDTAPGSESVVYIPPGSTCSVTGAFSVAGMYVGDVLNTGSSGTATVEFSSGLATNVVSGEVIVGKKGTLTHRLNNNGANQYKLCLKCASMTIASGATVHGDLKGPYSGATFASSVGSGKLVAHPAYGGVGGISSSISSKRCWGSIREPMDLGGAGDKGSNDSYKAGGAIYLEVAGELVVNGTISVLSKSGSNYYNGTGGSIYLKVGTLSGSGTIDASAGKVTSTAGAGGGRVSIRQSTATSFSAFRGAIKAYGDSKSKAGCGTIYLEHAGDTYGEGTLLIDSGPTPPAGYYCAAFMDSLVLDRNLPFGSVIVTNGAYLRLPSGATLRVKKRLCTLNGRLSCESGSSVIFEGSEDALVEGTNYIYSLSCTTPGKTIRFGTGAANRTYIVPNGSLTLAGEQGNLVNLRSKTDDTQWQLSIGADATVSISHCDVKDSNATFGMMPLDEDGVDSGNNNGWSIMEGAKPGDLIVWTGATSTSWTDASNWDPMMLPNDENRILIPAGCDRYPLIAADTFVNSLTNELGAAITLSGGNLIVTNDFLSLGTMNFGVNDVLKFAGDGDQKVGLGNLSYSRITADKSGGSIEFLHGFKAQHFLARARTPVSFSFAAGQTVEAYHLTLFGLVGESGAYDHVLTVGSPDTWYLKVTGPQHVRGVVLSNCDASLGADLKLGAFSTDGLGNGQSCDFSATAAAEWIGGGTSFLSASCWADGIVPQAETQVCICPTQGTYTVSTSAATATGSIVIGGDGGTVSFTSNYKHDIAGGLYMLTGASCTFGYWSRPNEIAGDFLLARGATLTHAATTSGSTELYKLNFEVVGDATLEAGSSVNVQNKGFGGSVAGPGRTAGGTGGSAFAGVGSQDGNRPYGSILHPFSLGSAGYAASTGAYGGGAFRLIAGGDVVLDGSIIASSIVGNYAPGTGGSVWISGASVIGKGSIAVRAQANDSWGLSSSAGRIAIYQTERIGWSGFTMSIDTAGFSPGTYYREDGSGNGELYVSQANNSTAQTWIPMGDDALADYKKVSVIVSGGNSIAVTNRTWRAGSTLVLRDMDLLASSSRVYLKSSRVKILSRDHKDGKGWTGGDYASRTNAATISVRDAAANAPGAIVWSAGFSVSVR